MLLASLFALLLCSVYQWQLAVCQEDGDLRLEFVQALWRHGERSALFDLYPIGEQDWVFGGGGYGEVTPNGMAQMARFGGLLRRRYTEQFALLSKKYTVREIHIRSTDVNRTIISAMSLLYGLYPPGDWNIPDVDYPETSDWQQGFTYVPVHVDGRDKCAVSQTCDCPRFGELWTLAQKLPEVKEAMRKVVKMNRQIAAYYGVQEDVDRFGVYPDTWKCQRAYFNETMYQKLIWYNEDLYERAQKIHAPYKAFIQGYFANSSIVDGVNVAHQMRIIRAGALLKELYERARDKFEMTRSSNLKFYGYSMHDNNVFAMMVVLGIQNFTATLDGWPDYASGVFFEFYRNVSSQETLFKVLYRSRDGEDLREVTELVPFCAAGTQFCTFSALGKLAQLYAPEPDIQSVCLGNASNYTGITIFFTFIYFFHFFPFSPLMVVTGL